MTPIPQPEMVAPDLPSGNMTENFRSYMGHLSDLRHHQDAMDVYSSEDSDTGERLWVERQSCQHGNSRKAPKTECNVPLVNPPTERGHERHSALYDSMNPYSLFNLPTPSTGTPDQHYHVRTPEQTSNTSGRSFLPHGHHRVPHRTIPFHQREPSHSDMFTDTAVINRLYENDNRFSAFNRDLPNRNTNGCHLTPPFNESNRPMCRPCARKPWQPIAQSQQVSGLDLAGEPSRHRVLNEQIQGQTTPSSQTGANNELLMDLDDGAGPPRRSLYELSKSAFRRYQQLQNENKEPNGTGSGVGDNTVTPETSSDRDAQDFHMMTTSPILPEVNLSSGSEDSDVEVLHIETNRLVAV